MKSLVRILSLILYAVIPFTAYSQAFFNKVNICDSCFSSGYYNALFNSKNELIVFGKEINQNTYTQIFHKYLNNSPTYITYKYSDTLNFDYTSFFQSPSNSYYILAHQFTPNDTSFNGTCTKYLNKYDTSFNIISKTILDTKTYDSADYYKKVIYHSEKLYCFGEFLDSSNNYWIKSAGFAILDTNGNSQFRKAYHIFPNLETKVLDVVFSNSYFYIIGYFIINPDKCTDFYDGFILKIDTNGNLINTKQFNKQFANSPSGISVTKEQNLFLTGSFAPSCSILTEQNISENIVLNYNLSIEKDTNYIINGIYNLGVDVQERTDSTMMTLTYRSIKRGLWKDFIFQVCDNNGRIKSEAIHQVPDSCLLESNFNKSFDLISNPINNGFVMIGSSVRQKQNDTSYYIQPWILSVDSNGCVLPNCAIFVGLNDIQTDQNSISIFPNPSSDRVFYIKTTKNFKYSWKISDYLGSTILIGNDDRIDLSNVTAGIYYLILKTTSFTFTQKLFVQ